MTVRVGVIGVGALGHHHARILRGIEGARMVGFHEANTDRAAKVASDLALTAYPSEEALLAAVDAVTIVVPTPAHFEVASKALEAGKHVLVEKPIATTLEEADGMLAIAKRKGVLVQTGHVERFNRAIRGALQFVDQPRFIESDRLAPFNPRGSDVAVVLDLMIHDIDLVQTLVGGPVKDVSAVGVPVLTPFVDIANARLTFASGAVANITASRVSRERMRKVRLFQQTGYLSLDLGTGTGEFYHLRKDMDFAAFVREAQGAQALEQFVVRETIEAPEGDALTLELQSFVDAVRGKGPVPVTGEAGRDALAVALKIVSEIERGMPAMRHPMAVPSRA
jgi:predicted dehydrogenase